MKCLLLLCIVHMATGLMLSILLLVFRRRFSLSGWLQGNNADGNSHSPTAAVVVAARNEEQSICQTLRDFAALSGVGEVVLVDDGSEDNTLQEAQSVAADVQGVRVLEAPPLPPGWMGKTHAIHWASQFVAEEFILFTDADVQIKHLPLQHILAQMDSDRLDHVGGNFRFSLTSGSEAVVGPVFATIAFIAMGLAASRSGAGSGAFNLVRTSAYRRLDGHLAIRNEIVDDMALAAHFKKNGLKSRFIDTSPAISVRLFEGLGGLFASLSRWSVLLSRPSISLVALGGSLAGFGVNAVFFIAPMALLFAPGVLGVRDAIGTASPWMIFLVAYLCATVPFVLAGPLHTRSRFWGFAAPVGALIMAGAVATVAVQSLRKGEVKWRGRSYSRPLCSDGDKTHAGGRHDETCN